MEAIVGLQMSQPSPVPNRPMISSKETSPVTRTASNSSCAGHLEVLAQCLGDLDARLVSSVSSNFFTRRDT